MSVHRSRGGFVLLSALVLDSIGNGMFMPLSVNYFQQHGATGVDRRPDQRRDRVDPAGPAITGWLADRIGPLPLVVASQVEQGIGFWRTAGCMSRLGSSWRPS